MRILAPFPLAAVAAYAQQPPIVLKTRTLLDGKGKTLQNTIVVVEGSRISHVGGSVPHDAVIYDLTRFTVTPGWIDTHSHVAVHFDDHQRLAGNDEPPAQSLLHIAENLAATLNAGFTTVQSPGAAVDKDLRAAVARGVLPGPRILTSLEALTESSGGPDRLRELVRERKAQGADFIKIFASKSIREGGGQTLSDAQLQAACGEAKRSASEPSFTRTRPNRPRPPRWPVALRLNMAPTSLMKSSI